MFNLFKQLYDNVSDFKGGETDFLDQLAHDLKRHEGLSLAAYRCTAGVLSIGYGHTADVKEGDEITEEEAEDLLYDDLQDAINDAKACVASYDALDPVRRGVIVNMAFNLGRKKLSGFHNTINHINNGNYVAASEGMLASKWRKDVKGRALELAERMRTGKIAPEHLYKKGKK